MHQIILITAMSATTGLFGGKHCGKGHHGHKAVVASCYSASPCGATYTSPSAAPAASMQSYPATPQAAPAPMAVPAAPVAPAPPAAPPAPVPAAAG